MFEPTFDFEFNMLGIYNYKQTGKLSYYFEFLDANLQKEGDLIEAGVFRGYTLLAVALFLKEKKSDKKVYGYDSFKGFPPIYHENDSMEKFEDLYSESKISEEHYKQIQTSKKIRQLTIENNKIETKSISSSSDFKDTSKILLENKIDFLGLNNIILVDGDFTETMEKQQEIRPKSILGGIIDCDLYESYKIALNFIWPKLAKTNLLFLDEYYSLKFPGAKVAVDEFIKNKSALLIKNHENKEDFERWYLKKA